jgi:hypothetical protein
MNISQLVAEIPSVHPYSVPAGYFEGFAGRLMARIHSMDTSVKDELEALSPLLSGIEKKNPFSVPEGYFTEMADNLVSGMKAIDFVKEELETPILQDLKHRQVYTVPAGYFDSFPSLLMHRIRSGKAAPVVKMRPVRRVLQYAAAAAVTAIVILGVVFFSNQNQQEKTLAATLPADSVATQNISKLSDDAIFNYVENEGVLIADNNFMATGTTEIDEDDMREMLTDIPDEELRLYVETHGGEKILTN